MTSPPTADVERVALDVRSRLLKRVHLVITEPATHALDTADLVWLYAVACRDLSSLPSITEAYERGVVEAARAIVEEIYEPDDEWERHALTVAHAILRSLPEQAPQGTK